MNDDEQRVVAFTVRNVSSQLDKNLSAIAAMEGKSKNTLIIEALEREFLSPISSYGRKSGLVKAMDLEICRSNKLELIDSWFENEHIIKADKTYRELLDLKNEEDVDRLFKNSFPLIDVRAKQVIRKGHVAFPPGISLTFALFIGVASTKPKIIQTIKSKLFWSVETYYTDINEIRSLLALEAVNFESS